MTEVQDAAGNRYVIRPKHHSLMAKDGSAELGDLEEAAKLVIMDVIRNGEKQPRRASSHRLVPTAVAGLVGTTLL